LAIGRDFSRANSALPSERVVAPSREKVRCSFGVASLQYRSNASAKRDTNTSSRRRTHSKSKTIATRAASSEPSAITAKQEFDFGRHRWLCLVRRRAAAALFDEKITILPSLRFAPILTAWRFIAQSKRFGSS